MKIQTLAGLVAIIIIPVSASAQNVIRIERNSYYGATISFENGVKVIRALPSHQKVIPNPSANTQTKTNIKSDGKISNAKSSK